MERIVVNVYLPAAGKGFDVRVPLDLNVEFLASIVAKALSPLSEDNFLPSSISCLAHRDTGILLNPTQTLRQCGIDQGSSLILI